MFRLKIVFLLTFFLIGCVKTPVYRDVKIAVPVRASKVNIPKKPYLPIAALKKNSSPDDVIKSYVVTVKILQGYSDQLRRILIEINK